MDAVQPSPIIVVAGMAREMKAKGEDVVSLSIGVPGFLPPAHVYEAAHAAVDKDTGDYLAGRGSDALVQAFIASMKARGFDYTAGEVTAQNGGKGLLFNLFLALLDAGDEVVIPAPYWASYPEMVKIVGGTPAIVQATAEQDYKMTPAQLEAALGPNTKAILFNNPSNPTGMLYSADEVKALAGVLVKHPDVWVISDDIYDMLVFDGSKRAAHLLDFAPELKSRTIIIQSVSKTYGMPGWRVGMVAAPKQVVDALLKLTSQSHTNLPAVTMAAAAAAFGGDQNFLAEQKARLMAQRDTALAALANMDGVTCPVPQGAFYVFPQVRALFGKTSAGGRLIDSDVAFCEALLAEARVAVVPGGAFGDDGAIRISYAGKADELAKGLARMGEFVASLR
ncbi:MAG: pyridoxal phosphate-dependent aminotransferase [Pseudomonadaceae bacterium]|nr:pyridoxal phosphate-dependent aminotransferase [Pseudomonadaceae bacterium]